MPARTLFWTGALTFALATAAHAAITISSHKTKDESCIAGVCTPTGPNPNIRVKDLEKLLAHSDVKIVTGQGSTGIGVLDPLTWASSHRLTLDANQSIHVRAPIVVEGTGGVTLITNDGGTGGDYYFDAPGSITFWDMTGSLVINKKTFTLVKDLHTLGSDAAAHPSGRYALAASYDASPDGTYSEPPVATTFLGAFEGLGNTIANLTIVARRTVPNVGVFSLVRGDRGIRDVTLSNANVSGGEYICTCSYRNVGALVGTMIGPITHVNVSGRVFSGKGPAYVGGLIGVSEGGIANSSFSGTVSGAGRYSRVGGLAGQSAYGFILQSVAIVNASGGWLVGGLAGSGEAVTLSRAYGTVRGVRAGGLLGDSAGGVITQSFASVDVTAWEFGGGLIGSAGEDQIAQSYSTGSVEIKGPQAVPIGGFAGVGSSATVSESYAAGHVKSKGAGDAGGFMGACYQGTVSSVYWDVTASGQRHDPCGATGLTDAQLKSALPAGFDPNVWGQSASINNGWPYLLANPPQ